MKKRITAIAGLAFSIALLLPPSTGAQEQPADGAYFPQKSSEEFKAGSNAADQKLAASGLDAQLESPILGGTTSDDYEHLLDAIRAARPIDGVSTGSASASYDIIVQPGHYGRTKGRVGTSGKLVSEQSLVAYIVGRMAIKLRGTGLRVLVIPADGSPSGLRAKVFLAVHADGSEAPCHTGPSMAYKKTGSLLPMHAIGYGLARAYGYDYTDFRKDDFTVDEANYYMFGKVNAPVMTGLLEVGELTCPKSEVRLIQSSNAIADNVAAAIMYVVQAQPG